MQLLLRFEELFVLARELAWIYTTAGRKKYGMRTFTFDEFLHRHGSSPYTDEWWSKYGLPYEQEAEEQLTKKYDKLCSRIKRRRS